MTRQDAIALALHLYRRTPVGYRLAGYLAVIHAASDPNLDWYSMDRTHRETAAMAATPRVDLPGEAWTRATDDMYDAIREVLLAAEDPDHPVLREARERVLADLEPFGSEESAS